jgi:hypothetical protein
MYAEQLPGQNNFFDFFGSNAVKRNVIHSIWRPDELVALIDSMSLD